MEVENERHQLTPVIAGRNMHVVLPGLALELEREGMIAGRESLRGSWGRGYRRQQPDQGERPRIHQSLRRGLDRILA